MGCMGMGGCPWPAGGWVHPGSPAPVAAAAAAAEAAVPAGDAPPTPHSFEEDDPVEQLSPHLFHNLQVRFQQLCKCKSRNFLLYSAFYKTD